ncbi:hypothetical protein [Rheinheimera metallidurans]|uniref:carboxylate--amine ligase n=1 Tax=Rheinheimera metallidurans TaxID=2925781 RepID=UPI0030034D53
MTAMVVVLSAGPNGLGVTRSLYLIGVRPIVISRAPDDVINFSRLPSEKIVLPRENSTEFLQQQLLKLPQGTIVIPTSDWFVSFLAENDDMLIAHIRFLLPSPDITTMLIDKALETKKIAAILPLPQTVQKLTNSADLLEVLKLPIIIKPRSHQHMVLNSKNRILNNPLDVQQFFQQFSTVLGQLIAQEVILGDDSCQWVCNCFFDYDSELVQAFSFNRLRLSPSHYGVTSYAISQYNAEVIALSKKLGKALGYVGAAMLEFKFDVRDGAYKYIELNPRLGMCNYFDTRCGVNNAAAYYQLLSQQSLNYNVQMKSGVVFLSLYEDFFSRRKDGEHTVRIVIDYLRNVFKPHVFIYHVWWDAKPSIHMLKIQLKRLFNALVNKVKVH